MSERVPAEVFAPGEFIRDELDVRGWTQQDLADILDRPLVAINQVINGNRAITPETAKGLSAVFGQSAQYWLNLESMYQLYRVKTDEDGVRDRAKLFAIAPVNEMVRRGWIEGTSEVGRLTEEVSRFFKTDDLENIQPLQVAARKSGDYTETTPAQLAWFYRASWLAESAPAGNFDLRKFQEEILSLRNLTMHPENIQQIPSILSSWGIRLILLERLQNTRIDGAAFWLEQNKPVVVLSLRYDRIDAFWHTLMHELFHIFHSDQRSIDSDLSIDAKGTEAEGRLPDIEEQRNEEACKALLEKAKLESFILRTRPLYSKKGIIRFSQANNVHPGIVVGQLQYRQEIPWSHSREMLVPIRHIIQGYALTDGWGHTVGNQK